MRIYERWAGNPKGTPEDTTRCVVSVAYGYHTPLTHQCSRRRGKGQDGLFCGLHAKKNFDPNNCMWIPEDKPEVEPSVTD